MDNNEIEPDIDDIIKALPVKEKVPVAALKKLLDERDAIDEEEEKMIVQTKLKYQKLIQPLLVRASEIIRGGEIKPEEIAGAEGLFQSNERINDYRKGKVIEDYWNGVFLNSALVDQINEKDEKALKFLLDIQKIDNPHDIESIELKFIFKTPNPFFNQTQVTRKLNIKNEECLSLEGDLLSWKENQCLTHVMKKVTNKKTGQKMLVQGQRVRSFFDIFLNYDNKNQEQLERVAYKMREISSLLLYDSVDYFLGLINGDEESEQDEGEDQEGEESESEQKK